MNIINPFYKKTIPFRFKGNNLSFDVAQNLFSSVAIDHGTQRLLRTLLEFNFTDKSILDMGCGYGPIGISLAKSFPKSTVFVTDIDALALTFTQHNAQKNNVEITTIPSIGFDNVENRKFDLILSNIPAKIGQKAIKNILLSASVHLNEDGFVRIVVIDAIADDVKKVLQSDEAITISLERSWPGHHVFHYSFSKKVQKISQNSFEEGVYDRLSQTFTFNKKNIPITTVYSLPEFDTLDYETGLLLDILEGINMNTLKTITVIHPGQGYLPLAVSTYQSINTIKLIDRNLLALENSKRNLLNNNFDENKIQMCHQIDWENTALTDFVIGTIAEKETKEIYELLLTQAIAQTQQKGYLLFSSTSHVIQQIEDLSIVRQETVVKKSNKYKGKSVVLLQRK
jgi:16S rRNA (guanine1207-N2)-methyltransferase